MKLLYVSSEAFPFAATGGLGDVLGSLPPAVRNLLGEDGDVRVVLPLYPVIRQKFSAEIRLEKEIVVPLAWRQQYCGIWSAERGGVKFYFLDNEYYFKRPSFYGSFDDGERFAFFGKAVTEMMRAISFYPYILHANDWQSALSVIYLKRKYAGLPGYRDISTLYTIHNIEYQGIYDFSILGDVFELGEEDRGIVEHNGTVNLTKGAITVSDRVSTVSETYARELMTPEYAHGLDGVLRDARHKLCGIVNGIDVAYYNPESDPALRYPYSAATLTGKDKDKAVLQKMCGFDVRQEVPLIAMVSRLASHKGFDLVCCVLEEMLRKDDMQFVLLGTGEPALEDFFREMTVRYPGKMHAVLKFDKDLSKHIYAGADIFLMPSRSEPCGLSQMIASRYGAVPIVRETGGLYDTIHPYRADEDSGNGFTFAAYNAHDMMYVLRQAEALYADRCTWRRLMRRAMRTDFSWNASAQRYLQLYQSMLTEREFT